MIAGFQVPAFDRTWPFGNHIRNNRERTPAPPAAELVPAAGRNAALDRFIAGLKENLKAREEAGARRLAQDIALAVQAARLVRFAPEPVAQAFFATRLGQDRGHALGTVPENAEIEPILARAWPLGR